MPRGVPKGLRKKRRTYVRRKYHDAERWQAIALAHKVGPVAAGETLGIPNQTVSAWVKGFTHPHVLDLWEACKGNLALALDRMAWDSLSLAWEKLDEASFMDAVRATGIFVEKARLLRGEPTVVTSNSNTNENLCFDLSRLSPDQRHTLRELLALARCPVRVDTANPDGAPG